MDGITTETVTDRIVGFYDDYYRDEIGELARKYPSEQTRLLLDYSDVFQFDSDLARDWLDAPDQIRPRFNEALRQYDLPADASLDNATVVLIGLDGTETHLPNEL